MIEGILLGMAWVISLVISFKGVEEKYPFVARWVKRNKMWADLISFLLMYFTISAVSKSIVALFASTIGGLFLGFLLHAADVKEHDPEFYNAVTDLIKDLRHRSWDLLRTNVLQLHKKTKGIENGITPT